MGTESIWEESFVKDNKVAVGSKVVVQNSTGRANSIERDALNDGSNATGADLPSVTVKGLGQETIPSA